MKITPCAIVEAVFNNVCLTGLLKASHPDAVRLQATQL